jgi:hypothetical protein
VGPTALVQQEATIARCRGIGAASAARLDIREGVAVTDSL